LLTSLDDAKAQQACYCGPCQGGLRGQSPLREVGAEPQFGNSL